MKTTVSSSDRIAEIKHLLRFVVHEPKRLFLCLFLSATLGFWVWLGPRAVGNFIQDVIVQGDRSLALKLLGVVILAELMRLTTWTLMSMGYARLGQSVIETIRRAMIQRILRLPVPILDQTTSGSMMTRVVNDASALTDFFQHGFVSVLGNIIILGGLAFGIGSISPSLGQILLLVFSPILVACVFFSQALQRAYETARSELSELNSKISDYFFGMRTIRALGDQAQKLRSSDERVEAYLQAQKGSVKVYSLFHPTLTLGTGLMMIVLCTRGVKDVQSGQLSIGDWVSLLGYLMSFQQPLVEISDRWNFFINGLTSFTRIHETLTTPTEWSSGPTAPPFESIHFVQVSFAYPKTRGNALTDVEFEVRKKQRLGFVGESGSGKSTLLQLIYGFYTPTSGKLLWNGIDFEHYSKDSIRQQLGVVEQFPFLFVGSIRENITLFGKTPMDEQDWESLALYCGEGSLVSELVKKRDTLVSERGANLSMGERQMISFLRSWIQKPPLWILDEATAFFDEKAEREIFRLLNHVPDLTLIQVAHRPQALASSTGIYRVVAGSVLKE